VIDDVLGIPDQLGDALWRVESARLGKVETAGMLLCGMGGSAIGCDLAAAAFGQRLERPLLTVRGYELPSWVDGGWRVVCSSYSGSTEETLSCFAAAGELGAERLVVSTGGPLTDGAREAGLPVVGLPGIFQPRAAVAYMFAVSAELAALAGVGPRLAKEIEAAADFLAGEAESLKHQASEIAGLLEGRFAVIYGNDLTAPVASRWKTQMNENAKLLALASNLPEADHNEICAWNPAALEQAHAAAVFLEDRDQHQRVGRRMALTAAEVESAGVPAIRVETAGESRSARMMWAVMLGDLVSLELASRAGVDPLQIAAIDRLKEGMLE
jgi:glucose/mannose-6-phosphate isomerase